MTQDLLHNLLWKIGHGKVLLAEVLLWSDTAGIKKISLSVVHTTTKANQLYKRYSFVQEGLLINDRIHKDGGYYNTVIMGRLF